MAFRYAPPSGPTSSPLPFSGIHCSAGYRDSTTGVSQAGRQAVKQSKRIANLRIALHFIRLLARSGKVYTNPLKRICLARKFYAPLKHDIRSAYNRLVEDPQSVTTRDVDLMSMCIYGDRFSGDYSSSSSSGDVDRGQRTEGKESWMHGIWKEWTIPGPPAGTPALEYAFWLSSPRNTTAPTKEEVSQSVS